MNRDIFFWSTRSRLRRSTFVFFRMFLFRFESVTKDMMIFVTIIAFDVCFIHAKAIVIEFFIFSVSIRIVYRCLNINKCVSVFRKIFVLFFRIKIEAIILLLLSRLLFFVFLTKFELDAICFENKIWLFNQISVVFWRSTLDRARLKKSWITWSKLKCRWIFVEIFERVFSNEMSIMINLFID